MIKIALRRLRSAFGSIRFRLTLWYVAILSLVLIFFSALVISSEVRNRSSETDTILYQQAHLLSQNYDPAIGEVAITSSESQPKTGDQFLLRDIVFFVLFNVQGDLIQQRGTISDADASTIGHRVLSRTEAYDNYQFSGSVNAENNSYRIYALDVLQQNQKIGTIVVGRLHEEQATLRRLVAEFLIMIPIIVLMTAFGAYWLASRAMSPVRAITRATREISETDLSRRLNLPGQDEIAELGVTFDQMLGRLEAAFERQRQFTRDASHELRTPLTIVNLELHHLLAQRRTPEEYERALSIIQTENQHMSHLVNDLLILARADAGQLQLNREVLDLSDLALEVVERLAPLAHQNRIDFVVGQLPELSIVGDRLYLIQMLTNLVENAIKYTYSVGCQVRIEVGSPFLENKQWAWLKVEDDGIGIATEHLPYLFDRFYRVDNAPVPDKTTDCVVNTQSGSGLGLSIVQWIVQMHGGHVTVHSVVGKGSCFEVYLPLYNRLKH